MKRKFNLAISGLINGFKTSVLILAGSAIAGIGLGFGATAGLELRTGYHINKILPKILIYMKDE